MQVLEGRPENVLRVFGSIERDRRHHGVTVILEEEIADREFGEWSMAFRDTGTDKVAGYSDFLNVPFNTEMLNARSGECRDLLLAFRRTLRL